MARPNLQLRSLDSPFVVRLYAQFQHQSNLYSLMVLLI